MTWIFFTFLAAFMQAWRNALQSKLSNDVSVAGVTLSLIIIAGPIAAVYLYGLYQPLKEKWDQKLSFSILEKISGGELKDRMNKFKYQNNT